ncbi:Acid sugar phosphatase [Halomicronema hongdechloris C2206]|uniref:Haloacid dehalogenase-like hydrolase domain-containing protein 2 n=1 Tax=Halomicronema hongdechloris C2206 TaxID=1641165 RepID=A0A1Z3HV87_9CYAN|nr:TIGR01458 family HAD-type hydrolase [Halomicronema hongdechloris]ASC74182.1 Acid sugar phosphatase [Halomicronema hongdechloris C2206]
MTSLPSVHGLLLDLNGVFYVANRPLDGAVEMIQALKTTSMNYRFVTNNTTESTQSLSQSLKSIGLPIEPHEIISAAYAAVLYLQQLGSPKIYPLLSDDAKQDFADFPYSDTNADVVVLGDMGDAWNYRTLNRAFRLIMQGAELVALHKGKYWQWEAGLSLDIGAFVTGLEYATDRSAVIVGKPSPSFFKLALNDLKLSSDQVAMVGDDIEADVGGAQAMGMPGILVKTGKYRPQLTARSEVIPDVALDSISDLMDLLG